KNPGPEGPVPTSYAPETTGSHVSGAGPTPYVSANETKCLSPAMPRTSTATPTASPLPGRVMTVAGGVLSTSTTAGRLIDRPQASVAVTTSLYLSSCRTVPVPSRPFQVNAWSPAGIVVG